MNRLHILFLFTIVFNSCFSQNKEIIRIKEQYIPLKTYENDTLIKNDDKKEVFSYVYTLNLKKDSVGYYNDTYESLDKTIPIIFVLKNIKQSSNTLSLIIYEQSKISDSLTVRFTDQNQTVTLNQKDTYFLNKSYYTELKNSISREKNILDLVDLLDDNLGDYPYQLKYLNRISSYKKYKNHDLKILKASLVTKRTQSDEMDTWDVIYKYSKNILQSVTKNSTEGEPSFNKKLLSKNGNEYKYKIYNNVESRFEDKDEVTFDIDKNTYSAIQNHFQFGLVKESTSKLKRILFKKE